MDIIINAHPKIVALIPAYNEDRFIGSVVLKAKQFVHTVIVVDDCSTDKTREIAEAAGAFVIHHDRNMGKAAGLNTAFRKAREFSPDVVVMLDGDGQHHPEDIPQVVAPILNHQAELVVGSRFLQESSSRNIPRWRVFGQHSLTAMTNVCSGTNFTDSQSGFRALSADVLKYIEFRQVGFTAESEMQFMARESNWRLVEVPIEVVYAEPAKRNPFIHALQVINGIVLLIGQARPLMFFGIPGVLLILTATLFGSAVVIGYNATSKLAIGYALITVLLAIVGTLSLFTAITLHSILAFLRDYMNRRAI
ncbi:MAG: glycosyltransferase family 2 protein [Chloroflexota bacterium]